MGRARAETVRVKRVRLMRWTIVAAVRGVSEGEGQVSDRTQRVCRRF